MTRKRCTKSSYGFTLLEILVVVIIMGILAIIIVPEVYFTQRETQLNTLKTSLNNIRCAIEIYFHHHNTYPGVRDTKGDPVANESQAGKAFIEQLTRYTDINGEVSKIKTGTYKFGPYLKSDKPPLNPFNNDNAVLCDITTTDISARASDGSSGWKFYTKIGVLIANDGAHDDL